MTESPANLTGSRFEEILIHLETQLLAELPKARAATSHGGDKGAKVEAATRELLSERLPSNLWVGCGKVYDAFGGESGQSDVVIANQDQPFTYPKHVPGEYLIEGVSAIGEVKSKLTAAELTKSVALATKYKSLRPIRRSTDKPSNWSQYMLGMTRWHQEDLAGELLAAEPDIWTHTNVPAIAETGVPDALSRDSGAAMTSALGFTPEHYAAARRTSGERAWYALYMGSPTTPQGGLIKAAWLDTWRMAAAPTRPLRTIVAVDPSDSGKGNRCGIIAASQADGVVALIADRSEPLTSEQWARRAVELAVEVGASQIAVETYTAGETYVRIVKDTLRRMRPNYSITVTPWRGKGDALARSAAIRQAFEVGTCRIAGHLPEFESAAVSWQTGQHQPDSLAAAVIASDRLSRAGAGMTFGAPVGDPVALASYLSRKIGS
ncbi:DUF6602 domain-containing protein [Mycobacteroides franklinii]|uniref:DUF6602 domain-containing protein n=1 Tax=Mycobacteroides franklinii TaxID=948102 RepID=UPI0019D6432E